YGEFTTPGTNPCAVAPTLQNPTNLTANSVKLNWANKTGASDYKVWISGKGLISTTNGVNTYTATDLAPGSTYTWSVRSVCGNNGSYVESISASGQFTTTGENPCEDAPAIQPPTDLQQNSVTLNWENKVGASDYKLWISGKGVISTTGGLNNYTVTGLAP